MAIVRWDPWRDLAAFERQLDQMMGRMGGGAGSGSREQRAWSPSLDVHQEGETMVICAEVAGIDPDQIDISVEDDVLTISGSREDHNEVEEGQWIRRERYSGQFRRSVSLPPGVDPEQIQASARNGLIEIRVPRPTQVGAHRVPLRGGGAANGGGGGGGDNGGGGNGGAAAQSIDVTSTAGANAVASDEGTAAAGIVPGTEEQAAATGTTRGEAGGTSPGHGESVTGSSGTTSSGGSTSGGGNP